MNKLLLFSSIILLSTTFCSSPEQGASNGADTLKLEEPVYEKASQKPKSTLQGLPQEGVASYYANRLHGRPTASGETYDSEKLTAAHRTLPFGTKVKVTNLRNDKSVVVTINDRGPHHKNRIIDVSKAAAQKLGFLNKGTTRVRLEEAK